MHPQSRWIQRSILLFLFASVFIVGTVETSAQAQNSVSASRPPAISVLDSTKERDGLIGSVRRVRIESAKVEVKDGRPVEGPRQLLELTTYGINGERVENTSYPGGESLIGDEEYKYDDRGNIIEMTLRNGHGDIINREAYSYEFDTVGNWTKMVTSLIVFENGKLKREPVEVTYRSFTYYFNESIAKIAEVANPRNMLPLPEPREYKALVLTKDEIDSISSGDYKVSASLVEITEAPPPAPGAEKAFANHKTAERETNAASSVPASEIDVKLPDGPTAINTITPMPNAGVKMESKRQENPSAPLTTRDSSAVAASKPESARVNFNPSNDAGAQKTPLLYNPPGLARGDVGDMEAAVKTYRESIKLEPKQPEVFLRLGSAYLKLKRNTDAVTAFKQALLLNPSLAEAQYGLGLSFFRLNRLRNAVVAFKKAIILDPKMAKAHFGLGMAYQELNENSSVVEEYKVLEDLDQDLAKRLAQSFRNNNLGCGVAGLCK